MCLSFEEPQTTLRSIQFSQHSLLCSLTVYLIHESSGMQAIQHGFIKLTALSL